MGFEPNVEPSEVETANEFVERMKSTLEEAKSAIRKSKDDMTRYYDRRREPAPVFRPGDLVFLDSSDIQTTRPSRKLAHKWLGPYPVERAVGQSYRLQLPRSMQRLHPVFPVIKLRPAPPDPIPGRRQPPPPDPEVVDGEERWEVVEILNSRFFRKRLQYLVSWKGFGYEENSWEDEKDVDAPDLIREFYQSHPGAPRRIRAIQFGQLPFQFARADTAPKRGGSVRGTPFSGLRKVPTPGSGRTSQLQTTPYSVNAPSLAYCQVQSQKVNSKVPWNTEHGTSKVTLGQP